MLYLKRMGHFVFVKAQHPTHMTNFIFYSWLPFCMLINTEHTSKPFAWIQPNFLPKCNLNTAYLIWNFQPPILLAQKTLCIKMTYFISPWKWSKFCCTHHNTSHLLTKWKQETSAGKPKNMFLNFFWSIGHFALTN